MDKFCLSIKILSQGVLHKHGRDSLFLKEKIRADTRLKLKPILIFFKDLLEIALCFQSNYHVFNQDFVLKVITFKTQNCVYGMCQLGLLAYLVS